MHAVLIFGNVQPHGIRGHVSTEPAFRFLFPVGCCSVREGCSKKEDWRWAETVCCQHLVDAILWRETYKTLPRLSFVVRSDSAPQLARKSVVVVVVMMVVSSLCWSSASGRLVVV
ncbi:hypothetical protein R1sor_009094 [Riccia sorocarpa]|uniref:Uncharacterized protein n=1 Tax=Riccia sorocarpa TaxID=122646 RepID=A0ABD3H4U3_9MARC